MGRLDWCRWIASCQGRRATGLGERWVIAFVLKLLEGDPVVRRLLAANGDPFAGKEPPTKVRGELYAYKFAPPPISRMDPYWLRERVGSYLDPLTLSKAKQLLQNLSQNRGCL